MINWYLEQIQTLSSFLDADEKDTFWIVTLILIFFFLPAIGGFFKSVLGKGKDE